MRRFTNRIPLIGLLIASAVLLWPGRGEAASISGSVLDGGGSGISGMQVLAWRQNAKGEWTIVGVGSSGAGGAYTVSGLSAGTYRVFARDPRFSGASSVWSGLDRTDHWHDQAIPSDGGRTVRWADDIVLAGSTDATGKNIEMVDGYRIYGRVRAGASNYLAGIRVRTELKTDYEHHHNVLTSSASGANQMARGGFFLFGLEPTTASDTPQYRILFYDAGGTYEPLLAPGPLNGAANAAGGCIPDETPTAPVGLIDGSPPTYWNGCSASDFVMQGYPTSGSLSDTYEGTDGNNSILDPFQITVPITQGSPWVSSGSIIGGTGADDLDVYCWTAAQNDRYLATTSTAVWRSGSSLTTQLDGELRYNPWLDPMLRWYRNAGFQGEDDDGAAAGPLDARIDTGEVPADGTQLCVVVTTYGDSDFNGSGQATHGRYSITIEMGNRRPDADVRYIGVSVNRPPYGGPNPPPTQVTVDEGAPLDLTFTYQDPDGDAITPTATLRDSGGNVVAEGNLSAGGGTGTWNWTPGQGAEGQYTLTISFCDGEFCQDFVVEITVTGVNIAPTTPVQLAPANDSTVMVAAPTLEVENAIDPDPDTITYDFELYYGADPGPTPATAPDQEATAVAEGGTTTTWTLTTDVPEDVLVFWRVRAFDGTTPSPWSGYWTFFVNTVNNPPPAPVLTVPADNTEIAVRSPVLTLLNSADPEGDAVLYLFEVASDAGFATIVSTSNLEPETVGASTSWTMTDQLDWGGRYWARAWAEDEFGMRSVSPSNVNEFTVKVNVPPSEVSLADPLATTCNDYVFSSPPPSVDVANSTDPENEDVTLEVEIYNFDDDPLVDAPVTSGSALQDTNASTTPVDIDETALLEDRHYLIRVRANDGTDVSAWTSCDFWIDGLNSPPTALSIISPEDGAEFPAETTSVTVTVQNAGDPDSVIPGTSLSIAWCASLDAGFADCDANPANWQITPSVADVGLTTDFDVVETVGGVALAEGSTVYVEACALDERDACGPSDDVSFVILGGGGGNPCEGVTCPSGQTCNASTGICESGQTGEGGCCTTARGGQPLLALFAMLALGVLRVRWRR